MTDSWIVLLPPVLVLSCAALTHNVMISLVLGITTASLIAANFAILPTFAAAKAAFFAQATSHNNIYLFSFLIILGIIIEMMTHSGGIGACTSYLRRSVRDKRGAETTSIFLSNFFFLDDYFNGLTVGAIMRPLTDSLRIPRIKLAYLINSMSSPMCLIIPASTWVAMILVQFQGAGMSDVASDNPVIFADPLYTYLTIIPFIFYALLTVFATWLVVRTRISFGMMRREELIAEETGNFFGGKQPRQPQSDVNHKTGSILGFFIPIGVFMLTLILSLLYTGNGACLGGCRTFIEALKHADTTFSLFVASVVSSICSVLFFTMNRYLSLADIKRAVSSGFMLTRNSIIILFLAYVFGTLLTEDLQAGAYLAKIITGVLPLFALPLIIFIISTAITAGTGSSWSTIAILTPLTIKMLVALADGSLPLALGQIPQFYATIGALLAGTVAGAHISPITDSTVMASTATGSYHMDHVQTQIAYSTPAIIGTCVALLVVASISNYVTFFSYMAALIAGIATTAGMLFYRNENR